MTQLSRRTQIALDTIGEKERTVEEWKQGKPSLSRCYEQYIVKYGVDAVAHIYLFRKAKEIAQDGGVRLEQFCERYQLKFEVSCGFSGSRRPIQAEGVFIPRHPNFRGDADKIWYFSVDNINTFYGSSSRQTDGDNISKLLREKWQPDDLINPENIERGLRYGTDLWHASLRSYKKYRFSHDTMPRKLDEKELNEAKKIDRVVGKLIGYYEDIIMECTP